MIYDIIADQYKDLGLQFTVSGKEITLEPEDVEQIVEDAAKRLYSEKTGTQYERAGIIVQKTDTGFAVFAFAGTLQ